VNALSLSCVDAAVEPDGLLAGANRDFQLPKFAAFDGLAERHEARAVVACGQTGQVRFYLTNKCYKDILSTRFKKYYSKEKIISQLLFISLIKEINLDFADHTSSQVL
jgi:hypothetical protein